MVSLREKNDRPTLGSVSTTASLLIDSTTTRLVQRTHMPSRKRTRQMAIDPIDVDLEDHDRHDAKTTTAMVQPRPKQRRRLIACDDERPTASQRPNAPLERSISAVVAWILLFQQTPDHPDLLARVQQTILHKTPVEGHNNDGDDDEIHWTEDGQAILHAACAIRSAPLIRWLLCDFRKDLLAARGGCSNVKKFCMWVRGAPSAFHSDKLISPFHTLTSLCPIPANKPSPAEAQRWWTSLETPCLETNVRYQAWEWCVWECFDWIFRDMTVDRLHARRLDWNHLCSFVGSMGSQLLAQRFLSWCGRPASPETPEPEDVSQRHKAQARDVISHVVNAAIYSMQTPLLRFLFQSYPSYHFEVDEHCTTRSMTDLDEPVADLQRAEAFWNLVTHPEYRNRLVGFTVLGAPCIWWFPSLYEYRSTWITLFRQVRRDTALSQWWSDPARVWFQHLVPSMARCVSMSHPMLAHEHMIPTAWRTEPQTDEERTLWSKRSRKLQQTWGVYLASFYPSFRDIRSIHGKRLTQQIQAECSDEWGEVQTTARCAYERITQETDLCELPRDLQDLILTQYVQPADDGVYSTVTVDTTEHSGSSSSDLGHAPCATSSWLASILGCEGCTSLSTTGEHHPRSTTSGTDADHHVERIDLTKDDDEPLR